MSDTLRVEVVANRSVQEDFFELLEGADTGREYILIPEVQGQGRPDRAGGTISGRRRTSSISPTFPLRRRDGSPRSSKSCGGASPGRECASSPLRACPCETPVASSRRRDLRSSAPSPVPLPLNRSLQPPRALDSRGGGCRLRAPGSASSSRRVTRRGPPRSPGSLPPCGSGRRDTSTTIRMSRSPSFSTAGPPGPTASSPPFHPTSRSSSAPRPDRGWEPRRRAGSKASSSTS
jgi:hypothetical protein